MHTSECGSGIGNLKSSLMHSALKYQPLTVEEERDLCARYAETRSIGLRNQIANHNVRLVIDIANEYYSSNEDLISEGYIGLLKGIERFNPALGYKLSTYVTYWIRASMLAFVMSNHRLVKLGTTSAQRKLFFNLQKEKAKLAAMGIESTTAKLAQELSVKETEVAEMEGRLGHESSLDVPIGHDSETTRLDCVSAEGVTADEALVAFEQQQIIETELAEFKKSLTPIQQSVFEHRMLGEHRLEAVGNHLGVTREYVRKIQLKVSDRLKKFCKGRGIDSMD